LKFLGHWVGEIHQPLHVSFEDDRGGNGILVTGICGTNLHAAWDTCLVLTEVGEDVGEATTELMLPYRMVKKPNRSTGYHAGRFLLQDGLVPRTGESNMSSTLSRRHIVQLALGATAALGQPASAHHGWSWAEEEQSTLTGTIVSVSMAPPHPQLNVKAADGVVWLIDLSNPNQTERSGFTAASAKPGDAVVVLGNRDKDKSKMHMKAVRITVAGKQYDMYPERIRTN
jgi:hypothetical protein